MANFLLLLLLFKLVLKNPKYFVGEQITGHIDKDEGRGIVILEGSGYPWVMRETYLQHFRKCHINPDQATV